MTKIIKRLPFASETRRLRIAADNEKRGLDSKFHDVVNFGKEKANVLCTSARKGPSVFQIILQILL